VRQAIEDRLAAKNVPDAKDASLRAEGHQGLLLHGAGPVPANSGGVDFRAVEQHDLRVMEMLRRYGCALVGTACILAATLGAASVREQNLLLDLLVWNAYLSVDVDAYPEDVRPDVEALIARSKAYQSARRPPSPSSEQGMVHAARVWYERRLVAMARTPEADDLAVAYVTELAPCYEWEGRSDCPAREAAFAATYRSTHRDGPFNDFLPLLEAHRWLCAAEGYDFEKDPSGAATARVRYRAARQAAAKSRDPLFRIGASELEARGSCFPKA
jgi:hypothetical protein